MAEKLKVAVLFGGRSGEHAVSRMSARAVLGALDRTKYEVIEVGITHAGIWLAGENVLESFVADDTAHLIPVTLLPDPNRRGLYALRTTGQGETFERWTDVDVYFPILHGTFGEDGTLQGLFEMANVAYVGAGVLGSSVGMDKAVFKAVMRANQISVVDEVLCLRSDLRADMAAVLADVEARLPYPVFVKPANMGSSVGVSKCYRRADLVEGLLEAARFDRRILIERGIDAREIEISVLGNDHPQASIPGEIRPEADFYSYAAKYHDDRSQAFIPADLPAKLAEAMRAMAVRAYRAIDCAGMARVDFLLERASNEFYLNEVNTLPGFTEISMYPKLWQASGMSYAALCDRLIELAVARRAARDQIEWRYEGER